MTAIKFNPFTYFEELKAAGVSEQQAKVQADTLNKIFEGDFATKSDILLLQKDMELLKKDIIIKLGSMIIFSFMATVSILGALIRFGH